MYAQQPAERLKPRRRWPWVVGVAAAFIVGGAAGAAGSGTSTKPAAASTVTVTVTAPPAPPRPAAAPKTITITKTVTRTVTVTPPPSATLPGDGTYLVPADMAPGVWRSSTPDSGNCYWARLSSVGSGDIIDNNNSAGASVVTVRRTDKAFETSGCSEWRRVG